ncbi:MAG: carbon-nitrogen family hydrolase [Planctomycetota bacterium]|nr:carbon-nitrogen family hydrolase [Planctomycetota bacterium]MDA1105506.1 carbon-nitrogen family hydrolase [Planctomycetota bacterium]
MYVAILQNDPVWEDKAASRPAIEAALHAAALPARTLCVLPEMCETGFTYRVDTAVASASADWFCSVARSFGLWLVAGAAERDAEGHARNTAFVCSPEGELVARYWKVQLFSPTGENRWYVPGDELVIVDVDGVKVAPLLCYDLRFPELFRAAARAGAEVFALGACWPAARLHHWLALARARAIENQALMVAATRTGQEAKVAYAGGSMIVDWQGTVLAEADDRPHVLRVEVDINVLRSWRRNFPVLGDMRPEFFSDLPRVKV